MRTKGGYNTQQQALIETGRHHIASESMPILGPSTYEEAIVRIEEAEKEIDLDGGCSWEDVMFEARQRAKRHEVAVY